MPRGVGKSGSLFPSARDCGLTRRQILGVSVSVTDLGAPQFEHEVSLLRESVAALSYRCRGNASGSGGLRQSRTFLALNS